MESKVNSKKLRLLPGYFKIIGLGLMILAFAPEVIIVLNKVSFIESQKKLIELITKAMVVLGLLFIALSKDKIEDEMTITLRMNTMAMAFFFAVIWVIVQPFIDILLLGSSSLITGFNVVVTMLIFYLGMYYLQKLGR